MTQEEEDAVKNAKDNVAGDVTADVVVDKAEQNQDVAEEAKSSNDA